MVLADVLSLLEHQFRSGRIQVRKELQPNGVFVKGVEYKLQQVFLNLMLNAVQAMTGGGSLELEVASEEGPQSPVVAVRVRDTGNGIPAEILPRIFDSFFTSREDGTGLGLAIVKRILRDHRVDRVQAGGDHVEHLALHLQDAVHHQQRVAVEELVAGLPLPSSLSSLSSWDWNEAWVQAAMAEHLDHVRRIRGLLEFPPLLQKRQGGPGVVALTGGEGESQVHGT